MPGVTNLTSAVLDETLAAIERRGGDKNVAQALREPKRAWSYAGLHEKMCCAAGAFTKSGLRPGERVLLLMHDGGELCAALLGAVRAGLCAVPVADALRPRELLGVLLDSGAAAVLAHADLCDDVLSLVKDAPALRAVFSLGGSQPGAQDFGALCFDADPHFDAVAPVEGVPALLLYDTGPGGPLRAYGYPHEVPLHAYRSYAEGVLGLGPEDRVFCTSRLASSFGVGMGLFFPLRAGAVSFLLPAPARSRTAFDVLGSFRPTVFAAAPSVYTQLAQDYLEMSAPRPEYFGSVRLAVSALEPMSQVLDRRLRAMFQLQVRPGFCSTEAFHVVLSNGAQPAAGRSGSCGQPLPGAGECMEVTVRADHGGAVEPAEIGQLLLRGTQLGGGPWCGTTQRLLSPERTDDGWVRTGERFFLDEDGFYYHVGRADGLFRVADFLVCPLELEQTLLGHPSVWECAAVEELDEDGLPLPKAFVVLNVGSEPSVNLARELIDFVKRQLSPHKCPRAVEFLDHLPRGPDGKVARWRLRSKSVPFTPPSGLSPVRVK